MKAVSSARDQLNQRLRFRRFLLASAVSALYLAVLGTFYTQGKIDSVTLAVACAVVGAMILVFFALFRLGLNLRFPDPSLTTLQILAAVFTMLFVIYRAPDTRIAFGAFFFLAMMFGMLRTSGVPLAVLGFVSLASFALISVARYGGNGDLEMLRLDILQLVVLAVTLPWFVFIGKLVRRLQEADRRKDEFLATLAHELRNPLAPIRTGVDILRRTRTDAPAHRVISMMERQVKQMSRLLDDLLDVSRITRGKMALHIERVDVRRTVQAAVEASRPLIAQMGHQLAVAMPSEPAFLDADPARLAQVVSNLLNNAARYTPAGGRIALDVVHRGKEIRITVSDTGIGIPADRLESIFDMFMQVGSSASSHGGLGIGLSLVKRLVTLHGGSIVAHSKGLGEGSEFRVVLPAAGARQAPSSAGRTRTAPKSARILVVDDHRDAAASLSVVLELMGHEVRTAHAGDAALATAEEFRPQVVLLDLDMPDIDGYETCRRLREQPWGEAITVIALSGWSQNDIAARTTAAGFDAHFVKPVAPEMLERLLSQADSPASAA